MTVAIVALVMAGYGAYLVLKGLVETSGGGTASQYASPSIRPTQTPSSPSVSPSPAGPGKTTPFSGTLAQLLTDPTSHLGSRVRVTGNVGLVAEAARC
jgi:hypothetical protein